VLTDLEGATGVTDFDRGEWERRRQDRRSLTHDTNGAIIGAYEAGASSVVVYDGHGHQAVQLHDLDPRAKLIKRGRMSSYLPGLDRSFTHLALVGSHAMAGSGGLLSHTYSLNIKTVRLNGERIGEIGLSFLYARHFGVSPVFLSGDDSAVAEAKHYNKEITAVTVKRSVFEKLVFCLPPKQTYELIRDGLKVALERTHKTTLNLPSPPYTLEFVYKKPWIALGKYLAQCSFNNIRLKNILTLSHHDSDFVHLVNKVFGASKYKYFVRRQNAN
jgi:D-amino peptidase